MYSVFEITSEDANNDYVLRSLKRLALSGRFDAYSNGGVNRRKSISFRDLASFRFPLPPLNEQCAISEVLRSIDENIGCAKQMVKSLAAGKAAVMRDLLTRGGRPQSGRMQSLPERWVLGRVAADITHIPSGWQLVRLTTIAKLESGHTPDRKQVEYWDGDLPWISLQDADALGKLTIRETAETIGLEGLRNSSARMLPAGTVVLQRTANVGLCSIMEREMCTSQHFANWVCGPKLLPKYLQQVFRHMQREWRRLMAGSVLPDIYMPTFKRLQILLPPIEEQEEIAEVGASFDVRIERERDALSRLEDVRAALAQELLSGRLRLPERMIAKFLDEPEMARAVNA
ncbi:hypothetical protein HJG53_06245 [Sphingomonas sp. ID1715]|uniref:restriction endonuclease subunit S n=1 Tax=Sphingomonas sp. ID1715 TaxID=1656898 RepID=UPI001487D6A3|nr:restriction endonuclease subunit S [Sphingomonas sp. ID1715]NNM76502.1 hypothetical protein [Sphingomonas sp. ID1715]